MPPCGKLQLALPVLRPTARGTRGSGNELYLLTRGQTDVHADELQSIHDATEKGDGRKSDRLPRLSYKQKANQERIEGGQLKF